MNIWFTSDTHFGHANIINFCRPEFNTVAEMDATLIDNWNKVVGQNDRVYHLGDFAWSVRRARQVRPQLNGTIRLIAGNHDQVCNLAKAGLFQKISLWREFSDMDFVATHLPLARGHCRASYNVHGHVHTNGDHLEPHQINISVEVTDYRPIHMDELIARFD